MAKLWRRPRGGEDKKTRIHEVDLSTLRGPGFGYRLDEMKRELPEAAAEFGR